MCTFPKMKIQREAKYHQKEISRNGMSITEPVSLPTSVSSLSTVDIPKSNENSFDLKWPIKKQIFWRGSPSSRRIRVRDMVPNKKKKGSDHRNRVDNKDISERRRTQYLTFQKWRCIATLTLEVKPSKSSSPTVRRC